MRALELAAQIQHGREPAAQQGTAPLTQPPLSRELSSEGKKLFLSVSVSDDDACDVDAGNGVEASPELETIGKGEWKRGRLLGQGSFGSVYQGLNLRTGALLAIKELNFAAAVTAGKGGGS